VTGADGAARFTATLRQDEGGSTTGVVIPPEVLEELGAGKRPSVRATLAGYEYRTTLGVMNGATMLSVSAAVRESAGVEAGDEVEVELVVDTSPREVDVPDDLATAMADAGVRPFFDGLANSLQRYHVDQVVGAKQPETRQRRIDKAVALFREGKKR
jgi:antitoxin component of MazEF toxin-antitoxin module